MASYILPGVSRSLPKLFVRGHAWRFARSTASLRGPLPSSSPSSSTQTRDIHTTRIVEMGLVDSVKERLGIKQYKYNRYLLDQNSVRLYVCFTEQIDFDLFFKEMEMEDTFNSWFRIMELHMWLILVRLAEEGHDGKRISNNLVLSLWNDMDKRTRKLGPGVTSSARKEGTEVLFSEFRLSLCSYDEGMLSDDMVLAGAIWRTFFQRRIVKPKQLETMVCYIRKQQLHLHNQDSSILLSVGVASLLPLYGDELDDQKTKELFNSIIDKT